MPYSGADDPKLPSNVKKLSSKKRRQWVAVWNAAYSKCQSDGDSDCESSAFAQANGVVKKGVYMADDGQLNIYVPITKKDKSQKIVGGYVSSGDVDLDGQIVDQDWLKSVLPPWMAEWGNIREQHDPMKAVGRAKTVDLEASPGPFLTAKIVDADAWEKVEEGVYNGLSVGIKKPIIVSDAKAARGRIIGGTLVEISIVDRPANDAAKLVLVKSPAPGEWTDVQRGVTVIREDQEPPAGSTGDKETKMADQIEEKAADQKPPDQKPAEPPPSDMPEDAADMPEDAAPADGAPDAHPFQGDHTHPHPNASPFGGTNGDHTHAHKHEGDDFHSHLHCASCGKDARACTESGGAKTSYYSATVEEKGATEVAGTETADKATATDLVSAVAPRRPTKLESVEAFLKEISARLEALSRDTEDEPAAPQAKTESAGFVSDQGSKASISPPKLEATFAVTPEIVKAIIGSKEFQTALKVEAERLASDTLMTKAAAADTLNTVADVSKLAGDLAKGLGLLADRAEASAGELKTLKETVQAQAVIIAKVEDMAAPAKGIGYAVEKGMLLQPDQFTDAMKTGTVASLAPILAKMSEAERMAFAAEVRKATARS